MKALLFAVVTVPTMVIGCGLSSSEKFPSANLDGAEIASKVMETYDSDGNGELSKSEINAYSALKIMLAADAFTPMVLLDPDKNGTVTLQELTDKLTGCFEHKRGSPTCAVFYKNRPMPRAIVRLVPEPFMGDIGAAEGETNEDGACSFTNDDGFMGGKPGFYRVEITHPEINVASRYNTESTLSLVIDTTNPYSKPFEFKLK